MKVLVTGASGFLGRRVIAELLRRGHVARALVRPATAVEPLGWGAQVEVVRGDVRDPATLAGVAGDAEALVHLAAAVTGDEEDAFATAVVGTEHLLGALDGSPIRRMVLTSSVTVYDWSAARGIVTEEDALVADPWARGGYTVAKLWQERVAVRGAAERGIALTILRPGFIWGPGNVALAGIGATLGRLHLVVAGRHRLPATHVDNCAHCVATVLEDERAAGRIYNVVDRRGLSAWMYSGAYMRGTSARGVRVPVPYAVARLPALVAAAAARMAFEHGGRLPSVLDPPRFEARFKPVRWSSERLERELGWRPPLGFHEAACRTFGGEGARGRAIAAWSRRGTREERVRCPLC